MFGNASTPPFVDCIYSLYPPKIRPAPTPGPVPTKIKDAVARVESSTLPKLKTTFKEKAAIDPAFVVDWSSFRSDQEVDGMIKHLEEVVVPALVASGAKPRGKTVVQSVKTVFIDQDSNVGGTICRVDGGMLRLRGAWGHYGPERNDCERSVETVSQPRRGATCCRGRRIPRAGADAPASCSPTCATFRFIRRVQARPGLPPTRAKHHDASQIANASFTSCETWSACKPSTTIRSTSAACRPSSASRRA